MRSLQGDDKNRLFHVARLPFSSTPKEIMAFEYVNRIRPSLRYGMQHYGDSFIQDTTVDAMKIFWSVTALVNIWLFSVAELCIAEPVSLKEYGRKSVPEKPAEGILLFIAADGRFFADFGFTSEKDLERVFKEWRAMKVEPHINLRLFPSLKSNSDLKALRRLIDFLHAHKVGYDIAIEDIDTPPEKDLL